MLKKPHFKPCYSVKPIEPDRVFFISEKEIAWLSDRLSYRLASLIDGHQNIDEIIEIIQLELLQDQTSSQGTNSFFQNVLDVSIKAQYALFQMKKTGLSS